MKNIILLLALATGLTHCKETPKNDATPAGEQPAATTADKDALTQIRGLLLINFGRSGLLDYPKNTMYEIVDKTKMLDTAYAKAVAPCHYMSESVFAVLSGKFVGKGSTGFDVFEVSRLDSVLAKTPENVVSVGVPFEFWCHGTEPFWDIEISHYEGGIFYQNVSDGTAWFCPWSPPKISGDSWTYNVLEAKGSTGAMLIKIRKEKSDDGMSEKVYDYSVEVTVNGNKYKGVAIKIGRAHV